MIKRLSMAMLCLAVAGALFALEKGYASMHGGKMSGESLMRKVEKAPYEHWRLWPGTGKMYEGTSPHGAYLTTYVNTKAYDAIKHKEGPLPYGSIIVKENYSKGGKLAAVTVMCKEKGANPGGGDWFYLKYTPEKKVQAAGRVDSCGQCHAKVKHNDYLFTGSVK